MSRILIPGTGGLRRWIEDDRSIPRPKKDQGGQGGPKMRRCLLGICRERRMVSPDTAPAFLIDTKKKTFHARAAKSTTKMFSFSPLSVMIQHASGYLLVSRPKRHNEHNVVPTSLKHLNPHGCCFSVCYENNKCFVLQSTACSAL